MYDVCQISKKPQKSLSDVRHWTSRLRNYVHDSLFILYRLVIADLTESRTAKDLAEQCIKVLELICTREAGAVFEAGGLTCVLGFIRDNGSLIHKDTLHSAMSVVSRLCTKMEPHEDSLGECVECLSSLLSNGEDQVVADGALKCFASLADRFIRKNVDPVPLASNGLTQELLNRYNAIFFLFFSRQNFSSITFSNDINYVFTD